LGHFVREVALYWLAYEITGSAIALGILGFAEAGPRLLLGAVGGVLVDRYDRLRLLTGIQFLCCLPVFGLVFIYFGILVLAHRSWAAGNHPHKSDCRQSILRSVPKRN
jgi:hypothetical protein